MSTASDMSTEARSRSVWGVLPLLLLAACGKGGADTGAAAAPGGEGPGGGAGDTGAASVGGKDGQTLVVTPTVYGTLHASWGCVEGGQLTVAGASTSYTLAAGPCPRELEVSAPPETAVRFTLPVLDSEAAPRELEVDTPALPAGVYQVGDGMSLEGELFDSGAMVLGYEFFQRQPGEGWGAGVAVVLDGLGRHLAHIYHPPGDDVVHKSVLLDPDRGELIYSLYSKDRGAEGMETNQVGRVALGGVADGEQHSAAAAPQAHHFLSRSADGAVQYLDVQRVCSYDGTDETLAYDRVLELLPDGSRRVLFDSSAQWLPEIIARLGVSGALDSALGGYSDYDCPDGPQEVRDVTHLNSAHCREDDCLIAGIGSVISVLIVDRASGEILHDLSAYSFEGGLSELHDVQWVTDDTFLAFRNGSAATGGYASLYQIDFEQQVVSELWTSRRLEDCIQADAMGWVSGIDGSGFEDFLLGSDEAAGSARMILSYGTGGSVAVEGVDGSRLGRLDFDANDAASNTCGAEYRGEIYAGEVRHYSDATLRAAFPDWIRLE